MKKLDAILRALSLFLSLLCIAQAASAQPTGQAVDLDGVNDDVSISAPDGPRTAYTVQVRIKFTGSVVNQNIILQTYTGTHTSWSHQIRTDAAGNFAHYVYDEAVVAGKQVHGTTVAVADQWYDLTITCSDGGYARLYVNGVEEGTAQPVVRSWKSGLGYYVGIDGGNNNNLPGSEVSYLKGVVDEVRIWDVELTPLQINQYRNCSLRGNYAGLRRCYSFNLGDAGNDNRGGSAGYVYDESLNSRPAYFENAALQGPTSNFVAPAGTLNAVCLLNSINVIGGASNHPVKIESGSTTLYTDNSTDFGTAYQNHPATLTYTVTNPGTAALTINNVTVSGPNASDFVVTSQPAAMLAAGGNTTFAIRFTPTGVGPRRAIVTVNSNATGAAAFTFAIGGSGGGVLPLTLKRFDAAVKGQIVGLQWETLNEQGTAYFDVERSANGQDYRFVARVAATGNNAGAKAYSAQDLTPEKGSRFYRLKMVDIDGKQTYSNVVRVDLSLATSASVNIAPNPLTNTATIWLTAGGARNGLLQLYNNVGQPVRQYSIAFNNGSAQLQVNRNGLASGTHFYQLKTDNWQAVNGKIVVQ